LSAKPNLNAKGLAWIQKNRRLGGFMSISKSGAARTADRRLTQIRMGPYMGRRDDLPAKPDPSLFLPLLNRVESRDC